MSVFGADQPWYYVRFEPQPRFEEFRHFFDKATYYASEKKWEEWKRAQEEILDSGLYVLEVHSHRSKPRFILHIEGSSAKLKFL